MKIKILSKKFNWLKLEKKINKLRLIGKNFLKNSI